MPLCFLGLMDGQRCAHPIVSETSLHVFIFVANNHQNVTNIHDSRLDLILQPYVEFGDSGGDHELKFKIARHFSPKTEKLLY